MMVQNFESPRERDEEAVDLRADRLEALCNLAYLMRHDIANSEKLESYLKLMDNVLVGMADDERRRQSASGPYH